MKLDMVDSAQQDVVVEHRDAHLFQHLKMKLFLSNLGLSSGFDVEECHMIINALPQETAEQVEVLQQSHQRAVEEALYMWCNQRHEAIKIIMRRSEHAESRKQCSFGSLRRFEANQRVQTEKVGSMSGSLSAKFNRVEDDVAYSEVVIKKPSLLSVELGQVNLQVPIDLPVRIYNQSVEEKMKLEPMERSELIKNLEMMKVDADVQENKANITSDNDTPQDRLAAHSVELSKMASAQDFVQQAQVSGAPRHEDDRASEFSENSYDSDDLIEGSVNAVSIAAINKIQDQGFSRRLLQSTNPKTRPKVRSASQRI